jgi:UDP-N-acetylglucosamine transferase subunit ALG13
VTVGTSSWSFIRLIKEMDRIAKNIDEEVIIQISTNEYEPKNSKYFRFASNEKIDQLYTNARVVVSHAGVGCIISALRHNKPNIVVPRRKEFGEHFDDHQIEIAKEMEKEGRIIVVWDLDYLEKIINNVNTFSNVPQNKNLVTYLKTYLFDLNTKYGG